MMLNRVAIAVPKPKPTFELPWLVLVPFTSALVLTSYQQINAAINMYTNSAAEILRVAIV